MIQLTGDRQHRCPPAGGGRTVSPSELEAAG